MKDNKISRKIIIILGIIIVIWFALLIAPVINNGLLVIIKEFPNIMSNPLKINLCNNSLKSIFICLIIYFFSIYVYLSTRKNYRKGEEYGSAKWAYPKEINKKYKQNPNSANKLLTQNVSIGYNAKKHRRNLNTLVCGGSGAGKTRFFCKPNIMQCNTSFVVLDPKGEILRDTGYLLERNGYEVKVLDLINMWKSHCYNPFTYLNQLRQKVVSLMIRFGIQQRVCFCWHLFFILSMKHLRMNKILQW